jgi:hypothetical protein
MKDRIGKALMTCTESKGMFCDKEFAALAMPFYCRTCTTGSAVLLKAVPAAQNT